MTRSDKRGIQLIEPVLPAEKEEHDSFSEANWGKPMTVEEREDFFATPTFSVVMTEGSEIRGLANCFIRDFTLKGEAVSYGAIGGVVTHKDFRHQGIASSILVKIIEELKERGIDLSILCTDIDTFERLYRSVGFVPLGREYLFLNKYGDLRTENGGMIAPCSSPEKVEKILKSMDKLFIGISNF